MTPKQTELERMIEDGKIPIETKCSLYIKKLDYWFTGDQLKAILDKAKQGAFPDTEAVCGKCGKMK